jgi:hypothetical protein
MLVLGQAPRQISGKESCWTRGVAIDSADNNLVIGAFRGRAIFGAGEPNETHLTSIGNSDIFVAKYAPNGSLIWVTQADGGTSSNGIAVDKADNIVATGSFFGSATFGAGEPNETVLTGNGMFIAKYASDGSLIWAIQDSSRGNGIAVDNMGNILVTGAFSGTATFGSGGPNETVLTSAGSSDIFVAKYTPDGSLVWVVQAGGSSSDAGNGIAVDTAGNGVVTGYFEGIAIFGAGKPNETKLTSAGTRDIFVAKYAPDGSFSWATQAGGESGDIGLGIAMDIKGNSMVTGSFNRRATFGATERNEIILISKNGGNEIFVAKYAANGNILWVTQSEGTNRYSGINKGNAIAVDTSGTSIVTGSFSSEVTFGAGEPNETTLTSAGEGDVFIAKFHSKP